MRIIRKLKYKINKCNLKNIICLWHKALNALETKPLIFVGLFQVEKHPSVFVCVFLFWLLVFGFFMLIIIIIELISLLPELILSICNTLKKFFKRPLLAVFRILKSLN